MNIFKHIILGLLLSFSFIGCGGAGEAADPTILEIKNEFRSTTVINEVYIALAANTEWGPNQLNGSIGKGQSKSWNITEDCGKIFDVKVVFLDGAERFANDIRIPCNEKTRLTASNR